MLPARRNLPCHLLKVGIFAALLAVSLIPAAATPDSTPYLSHDAIEDPAVSPDGKSVAFFAFDGKNQTLAVLHLDTGQPEALCQVSHLQAKFVWKGDNRIIFFQDLGDRRVLQSASPGAKSLNSFTGYGQQRRINGVVDWMQWDPQHLVVSTKGWGIMDASSGEVEPTKVADLVLEAGAYTIDNAGVVRLRCVQNRDGIDLEHRASENAPFSVVYHWTWQEPVVNLLGFGSDPNVAYFLTRTEGNWSEVRPFNLNERKFGDALVKGNGAELMGVRYAPDHSRIVGVRYMANSGRRTLWLDPTLRQIQASLDKSLAGRSNSIVSYSSDLRTVVAWSAVGSQPGEYYILDLHKGALKRLGGLSPQIANATVAPQKAVEIPARDGLMIHAILTRPVAATGPTALIVMPLEDLFADRHTEAFDPQVQFLASLGYAVLQVDYRGAQGYGHQYYEAGRHQLARKIPNDIDDATRWCLSTHITSPGRVGLVGQGFGATMALIVATHTPELYSCVVNWNGAPDLATIEYGDNLTWLKRKQIEMFTSDDAATLDSMSARKAVGRLNGPVLNIYLKPDYDDNSVHIKSALRSADRPFETVEAYKPGQRFGLDEYLIYHWNRVGAFLVKNLPPGLPAS